MAAENVYRLGKQDVHHAFRFGGVVFEHDSCRLDGKGNAWLPAPPPGPRCPTCFGAPRNGDPHRARRLRNAAITGTAAAALLVAVALAASLDSPVNILGPFPSGSAGPAFPTFASIAPGPSGVPPRSSEVPALTPAPTLLPIETLQAAPTFPPIPTYPPVPTFGPLPTWPPLPQLTLPPVPLPTLKACVHPGTHLGVDPCRWPHQ